MQAFEIRYETSENTPPPYSYAYVLKGKVGEKLHLHYQIQYTHREDLSEEEIIGEGFTMNDDLELDGEIDAVWTEQILQLLGKTKPSKRNYDNPNLNFFELEIDKEQGVKDTFAPTHQDEWEYLCEELCQALLEARQVERALLIRFKRITPLEITDYQIIVQFSKRQVLLKQKTKKGNSKETQLSWQAGKDFLELIFKPDYFAEDAQVHEPTHHGFFVNHGDNFWYEAGKSMFNRSEKVNLIEKIEKKLHDLLA